MRHPLWILNSALLVLLVTASCIVLFSRPESPVWEDITPSKSAISLQKRASEITISKIYEHDLFDTYVKETSLPQQPDYTQPFPPSPLPRKIFIPAEPPPQFLEPLQISLKGIIVVLTDDSKNRAIISDNKTKKEELYKVGDIIEDAQLIKISNKKVIFLRNNGQQEVLYLRPKDAQLDPMYATVNTWKNIVHHVDENLYLINPKEFTQQVESLAHFIDMLDITTVYKQGQSFGCRIGKIESSSLGHEMGFEQNDIIVAINGITVSNSQDRFKIYKTIVNMKTNDSIIVDVLRNMQPATLTFRLEDFKIPGVGSPQQQGAEHVLEQQHQPTTDQLEYLHDRHKFAPTLQDLREQERKTMLQKGRLPRNTVTSKLTE